MSSTGKHRNLIEYLLDGNKPLLRSLDLTLEILENAGATVLAAGQHMSPAEVVQLMINYHANVLSGESSQIVSIVHHIATLAEAERGRLHIEKIIYTSEGLAPPQKAHIREILGNIPIFSILGSAEAGPYALSCPHLTGNDWETVPYGDFVFDTRMTRLEILPLSLTMHDSHLEPVEDGQLGLVVQTSLTRLRNPLVRYVTGDVGSLHELPKDSRILVPDEELKHLRIFRLYGRDRRFSFEWDGNYLEFKGLDAMMNDPQLGVLQWQIVLGKREPSKEGLLEVRVLRSNAETNTVSENNLIERIETFFHVFSGNRDRFKLAMLKDDSGFARSEGGRKIVKFLDR